MPRPRASSIAAVSRSIDSRSTPGIDATGSPPPPPLSPAAEPLVFSWPGALWIPPASGGVADRLTAHPAEETRAVFSPSGDQIAFESTRDGARNLYIADLATSQGRPVAAAPRRVTISDRDHTLSGFSASGDAILFSATLEPALFRHARMYEAPVDGGPVARLTDAFGSEPRMAEDGSILFSRGYNVRNRPAYRGPGAENIWRLNPDGDFEKLAHTDANEFDPHPLPSGDVVFVSSRSGQNNLFRLSETPQGQTVTQLTDFRPAPGEHTIGHGVRDLAVSADGSTAAFAVWDALYTLDLTTPGAKPRRISLAASADDAVAETKTHDVSSDVSDVLMHPSGEAVAMVARGELFVRSTAEDRPARRITTTTAREGELAWSPDGTTLYFTRDTEDSLGAIYAATVDLSRDQLLPRDNDAAEDEPQSTDENDDAEADDANANESEENGDEKDEDPTPGERWAEALTFTIEPVVESGDWLRAPAPSPDGARLLFVRDLGDLVLLDLESGDQRVIFEGWNVPDVQWAADSRHIVYEVQDLNFNADIWLLDLEAEDAEPVNLTRHPDMDVAPRLSADGKVLAFLSDRAADNWNYDVHLVYLDKSLEGLTDYQLAEHFKDAAAAAKKRKPLNPNTNPDTDSKTDPETEPEDDPDGEDADDAEPLEFDADDAYLRIRRVTSIPGSEGDLALTPGGDRIVFSASIDGDAALHSVDHKGEDRKRVVAGNVSSVRVNLTGDKAVFTKGGKAHSAPITGGDVTTYDFDETVVVNLAKEQRQKFLEGARHFGATFYHPTLKGLDWTRLTERYADLAARTRTSLGFNRVFSLLLGEVDGSHTGIWGGDFFDAPAADSGYLGINAEPAERGYRVTRVLTGGPADLETTGLKEGDLITAVDARPLARNGVLQDLHAALAGTQGKETLLKIERQGDQSHPGYALVTPHSFGSENNLRYERDTLARREKVEQLSGGRLGYLHIRGMNLPSVRDFERDLFAAAHGKDGLIIDVRDNGGGFTTDILLASLTAPRHAYTIPRGADPSEVPADAYPRDRRLIYGYNRPITVLINENSFSNAEIFAHAVKTTGRGTLVGTQTFGGVISTGSFRLIDGTTIRQPFRGWFLTDDADMENNGARPDIQVPVTPADEAAGSDPQLEAAVEELLSRVEDEGARRPLPVPTGRGTR